MAAVVTLFQIAAESSGPADLDRGHDAALRRGKRSAVLLTIRLRRSGETHPLPQAWGDPCPGARSTVVERAGAQRQRVAGADQGDWQSSTPCW